MRFKFLYIFLLTGILFLVYPLAASSASPSPPSLEVKSGEVLLITVKVAGVDPVVTGEFRDRIIPFFKIDQKGRYGALMGIDLADGPLRGEVRVQAQEGSKAHLVKRYRIKVRPSKFGIQELTLPDDKVELDKETLKRVEAEQQEMLENLGEVSEKRLWKGQFIVPVEGKMAGTFGLKRIINGQPRNPHSGEDIYAPEGTTVAASNDGIVTLTGDFFFSGKSIIIDHGLGLFTMYFHLSEARVGNGEKVSKGQTIGLVGATGRATGPHLHWGARLNGARINPFSLVKLRLNAVNSE